MQTKMKPKTNALALAGFIAFVSFGFAQDNTNKAADTTAAAAQPGGVVPLIVIDDLPLNDAIKNLARGANLNYILDPHIPYGQAGADGKVTPQPSISIRWENITAEQALLALLNNYNLILTEDPKTKISRISLKDPAAPDPLITKIIQLQYSSPSNVAASVAAIIDPKRSKVVPDVRTSQLIVQATEKEFVAVDELVKRIDTQTKQVLIEAKILETTLNPKTSKGIDWSGTLKNQNLSFGNNLKSQSPNVSLNNTLATDAPKLLFDTAKGLNPSTAFLDADGFSVALSFLNNSADSKVISEPRMVTLDNVTATIDVGLLFPIVNTAPGTVQTSGGSQISYTNLTVNLDVTPRIAANDFIELKVLQRILRLGPEFTSTVGGLDNRVNSFFKRSVETSVLIPSGNTLVMGGLISDEDTSANTKVPVLGDIPGLGLLFRKDSKERNRQNLIVFITPTIVQDADFQPAHTDYLKSTANEKLTEEWSAWDSGKAKVWGPPIYDKDTIGTPKANSKY